MIGDWKTHVSDEIYRQREEVLVSCDMQILCQAIELGIADWKSLATCIERRWRRRTIASVQKRQQVKQRQWRKEFQIQLPQQSLLIDTRRICEIIIRYRGGITCMSLILKHNLLVIQSSRHLAGIS
jgi:hypothetical protein